MRRGRQLVQRRVGRLSEGIRAEAADPKPSMPFTQTMINPGDVMS